LASATDASIAAESCCAAWYCSLRIATSAFDMASAPSMSRRVAASASACT
jgi:hypothetical protein